MPPAWDSYISVEDADTMAARVKELGGKVIMEPFDVMGDLGRMTYVQDPQGAHVALWQPKANIGAGVARFAQGEGYLQVVNNEALVLVEEAIAPDDVDESNFQSRLKEAQKAVENAEEDSEEKSRAEREVKRYKAFLDVGS